MSELMNSLRDEELNINESKDLIKLAYDTAMKDIKQEYNSTFPHLVAVEPTPEPNEANERTSPIAGRITWSNREPDEDWNFGSKELEELKDAPKGEYYNSEEKMFTSKEKCIMDELNFSKEMFWEWYKENFSAQERALIKSHYQQTEHRNDIKEALAEVWVSVSEWRSEREPNLSYVQAYYEYDKDDMLSYYGIK